MGVGGGLPWSSDPLAFVDRNLAGAAGVALRQGRPASPARLATMYHSLPILPNFPPAQTPRLLQVHLARAHRSRKSHASSRPLEHQPGSQQPASPARPKASRWNR